MSVPRQLLLSLVIIAALAAGYVFYERPAMLFGAGGAGDPTAGQGPGGPGGGFYGFGGGATLVVTSPVELDSSGTDIRAIGTAAAAREVVIYPQVTGIVAEVAFTPGAPVDKDHVLVRLQDADQQVAVDLANIALDSARQAVERAQRLSQSGNVTAVTLSDAKTAEQKAAIDLKSAQLDLAKRTIKAPFDGVIGLTDVSVGDLVASSTAIATIADMSSVTVSFEVPERVAGEVAVGEEVNATAAAIPGVTITGKLSAIDNRIDETTRTLKVRATLPNETEDIKPGMAINIAFSVAVTPRPAVPSLAIQWDRDGSFVWTVDGDTVHRTAVQVVARRSGTVTVAGDLGEGDEVVVEGVLRLREGQKIAREGEGETGPPAKANPPGPVSGQGAGGAASAAAAERRS